MKKNFKVLSSLALAGMLTTSVMGTSLAITKDVTSVTPGVCSQIIAGTKNVVPFVLANKDDIITIKDIKDSGKFNMTKFKGLAVPDESTQVRTGDTFTSNGKDYTVVIYGDVDKNGTVNVLDALEIAKYGRKITSKLDGDATATELANVQRADASGVNILDALRIQRFVLGQEPNLVDKLPDADLDDVANYNYTLKVNDKDYINKENEATSEVVINIQEPVKKATNLTAKVLNSSGTDVTASVTGLDSTIPIPAGLSSVKLSNIDFSSITVDGPVTIQLLDVNGDIVGSTIVEKNIVEPAALAVRTERSSETDAKISLVADESVKSDIVKMHYIVVASDVASGVTWDATKCELTYGTSAKVITTGSKDVTNNELKNVLITNELTKDTAYKVYYVLENSYGSLSDTSAIESADILKDTLIAQTKVGEINVDENGVFSWTNPADIGSEYIVTVYRDGNIVAYEDDVVAGTGTTTYTIADTSKEGKYKIGVKAKGDTTDTKDSEEKVSPEFTVTALKSVTDINFEVEANGTPKFSWKDEKNNSVDVKYYTVNLYERNVNGTYSKDVSTTANTTGNEKEIKTLSLTNDKVYKVEVIAVKKDDKVKLANSKETVKEGIFKIATPTANNITNNSVDLTFSDVRINGSSAKYQVKIYPASKRADGTTDVYNKENPKTVDADYKDGKIVVSTGLEADHDYALQLIANVDGMQGTSAYVPVSTKLEIPTISNLTVVTDETKATTGKIWVKSDASEAIVNGGKKMNINDTFTDGSSKYPDEFKKVITLVSKLHADDVISVNNDVVELKLPSEETNTTSLNFTTTAKDMKLVIESNGFGKTIATTAGYEPKEVTLKKIKNETVGRFDVSGLNTKKIVLTKDVEVTGNQEYTVSAGIATINGVQVETQKETVITATDKTLAVKANAETNNLVFTNITKSNVTNKDAVINFVGSNSSKQLGTITIKTEGGSVTVSATNVDVQAKLDVVVNTGVVDVQDSEFTNTEIKVSTKGEDGSLVAGDKVTVKAVAKTKAPDKLVEYCKASGATALELKDYNDETDKMALKSAIDAKITTPLSNDELNEIINYMASFKINNKGATLMITNQTSDETDVTILFENRAVQNVVISNIK